MNITRAVITAAGPAQRSLPLQQLVDFDGREKAALEILCAEATGAGIRSICIVVHPGDTERYRDATEGVAADVEFVEQEKPTGYADALLAARDFVGGDSFLHLVGDHVWVATRGESCAKVLVERAIAENALVSAVQPTRETKLPFFGTVGARRVEGSADLWEVQKVVEKPTPTLAEQELVVPGLRAGHYLCFFGMHVLTPGFVAMLEQEVARDDRDRGAEFAHALSRLAGQERVLALELPGQRYNLGEKYGILTAQLAMALGGDERDEVMARLIEVLGELRVASS